MFCFAERSATQAGVIDIDDGEGAFSRDDEGSNCRTLQELTRYNYVTYKVNSQQHPYLYKHLVLLTLQQTMLWITKF